MTQEKSTKQPGVWRQVCGHQLKSILATRDFTQALQGRKPCVSCEVKTDFPTILLDLTSSELVHLELVYQTKSTSSHTADFSPFFTHKEPDKATARSSMSASPNLPWAQLDTANTSPDLQQDMAATHTFTQECLWSQEMLGIFSWCSPWKNKQTHTPSDSPITWLLLGGGREPHPASRKLLLCSGRHREHQVPCSATNFLLSLEKVT